MKRRFLPLVLLFALILATSVVQAQGEGPEDPLAVLGTGFTYQGQLSDDAGSPLNGTCDFNFSLWDALSGGAQVGAVSPLTNVTVAGGYFSAVVNGAAEFGSNAFKGSARWLEVSLRCPAGAGTYTTLTPRQALTAAPYARYAANAPWSGLSGIPADLADGDNNTTYAAGTGITLSGGAFSLGTAYRLPQSCTDGQIAEWDTGTSLWVCAADNNTTYTAGFGLTLASGAFSVNFGGNGTATTAAHSDHLHNNFWLINGNSQTDPATHYIGTRDDTALVFKVNGQRALLIEPNSTSPNLIGGYSGNAASAGVYGATIGGGGKLSFPNAVTGSYGTVSGGVDNLASGDNATVGGGVSNLASGDNATVGGGVENQAINNNSTVGGGVGNIAGAFSSTVCGGNDNEASGNASTIGGGYGNTAAGSYSFVVGNNAQNANAAHDGVFLFADSTYYFLFHSTAANQFRARATGGVQFVTAIDGSTGADTAGVQVAAGGGSWSALSDRSLKANFASVDSQAVLEAVAGMPISTWNYTTQDASIRHMGPMAQDFYAAFNVGEDDKHITTIDADGVALAAIQGLNEVVEEKEARISALEAQVARLQNRAAGQTSPLATPWPWLALCVIGLAAILRRPAR